MMLFSVKRWLNKRRMILGGGGSVHNTFPTVLETTYSQKLFNEQVLFFHLFHSDETFSITLKAMTVRAVGRGWHKSPG